MAANTPKRKKLEKTVEEPQQSVNKRNYYCCRCGTAYSRQKGYFLVSHSPMYRGAGYLPICIDCVEDLYDYYRSVLGNDREAMRRICMKLDLYWNDTIYESAEKTSGVQSRIVKYIGKTNTVKYLDKSFDDTLIEESLMDSRNKSDSFDFQLSEYNGGSAKNKQKIEISQELRDLWGDEFDPEFCLKIDKKYRAWVPDDSSLNPSERAFYKQISILEATIDRDAAAGRAIDKNVSMLNNLFGSMNLKPSQQKEDADAELEKMPLGVGIHKWEYYRPLPPTPEELKDVSGIIRNITTWFLGHTCKMVGAKNSYCKMYEDAMNELRVDHPELDEEDDDTFLDDIFVSGNGGL